MVIITSKDLSMISISGVEVVLGGVNGGDGCSDGGGRPEPGPVHVLTMIDQVIVEIKHQIVSFYRVCWSILKRGVFYRKTYSSKRLDEAI